VSLFFISRAPCSMKLAYTKIQEMLHKLEETVPTKWPQTLPNMSTHNGKPMIQIENKSDYATILGKFSIFYVFFLTRDFSDSRPSLSTLIPSPSRSCGKQHPPLSRSSDFFFRKLFRIRMQNGKN
jgi:hypothetical protein